MRTRVRYALAVCLGVSLAAAAGGQTISLEADYYMPFNGDGKAETGFMIDIARAVFEPKGLKVTYQVTPWNRALEDAKAGRCTAVVGAGTDEAEGFVFPAEEQAQDVQAFRVKAGSPWKYAGIASLKGRKLAVIKDYTYFPELDDYIKANPASVVVRFGEDPLRDNLRLLQAGAVDVVVDSSSVLSYTVGKLGMQKNTISAGTGGDPAKMYIAFSPAVSRSSEYARILSAGMTALRKSGRLKAILAKYNLVDWK